MNIPSEITVVDYRPEWVQEFTALARPLSEALGTLALRIDHIGSTSVPGLAAKDLIDVQITVRAFTADLAAAFTRAGYRRRVDITHDHRPPVATGSEHDWAKQFYRREAPHAETHAGTHARSANVHVRLAASANGRYALLFRDYLRAHPLAAAAYAQAKRALAQHGPADWDLYYDVKDPICDIIMAGAEDWAAATGWRTEHY